MSIAPREAKWTMPSSTRPGQLAFGQYRIASPAGRSTGVPQLGARIRHLELRLPGLAILVELSTLRQRAYYLGDHLAGSNHLDPIADADVLLRDQILVVQRRVAHRDATDFDRLQAGPRIQGPGATHVDEDVAHAGDRHLGRELPGDRPARLPSAYDPELSLQREAIHLHDDAIGLEGEPWNQRLEGGDLRLDFARDSRNVPARLHRKTPAVEQVENLPVGSCLQLTFDRLDREREEAEPSPPRQRRIELPKAAGGRVPRVGEEGLALALALLVHPLEAGVGHVDLAARFPGGGAILVP